MPIDGVDTYAQNQKGERSLYQDYFQELPKRISKEAYEDIMYKNALRVFRLKDQIDWFYKITQFMDSNAVFDFSGK